MGGRRPCLARRPTLIAGALALTVAADGARTARVTPRLRRADRGTVAWAGKPNMLTSSDPFTMQVEIARDVAGARL